MALAMKRQLNPLNALYPAGFVAGLAAIGWAGANALAHHPIALGMTGLIAGFYLLAAWELHRFRQTSQQLSSLLAQPAPAAGALEAWLQPVPAPLAAWVQQRLQGLRVALPALSLAPALAALLVLLGMLGTFIGLVLTLGGTAAALGATADLAAMRAALTAPVKGLGLAFGTSVAGVAASAMLGLMVALARRERTGVAQQLERLLATELRPFSTAYQREQAEQVQAQALPALVAELKQFAAQINTQQSQFQQQFQAGWLAEQARFHAETRAVFGDLATAVQNSLQSSLVEGAARAGATLQPVVEATMAGIAREAAALHQQVASSSAAQLQAVGTQFQAGAEQLGSRWQAELNAQLAAHAKAAEAAQSAWLEGLQHSSASQRQASEQNREQLQTSLQAAQATLQQAAAQSQAALQALQAQAQAQQAQAAQQATELQQHLSQQFAAQAQALVKSVAEVQQAQQAQLAQSDGERLSAWREALLQGAGALQQQLAQSSQHSLAEQQRLADALADTARSVVAQAEAQSHSLLTEVSSLLRAASETPRAAAEMAAALREQLTQSLAQDNRLLAERNELAAGLQQLLNAAQQSAQEQRQAIEALQASAVQQLDATGTQFGAQVQQLAQQFAHSTEASGAQLREAATLLAASSAEMGALGEGFSTAVEQFHGSNEKLMAHLAQLDTALSRASTRSDEQMAYTVAQARELIDLCLMAQKQALDALRLAAPEGQHA